MDTFYEYFQLKKSDKEFQSRILKIGQNMAKDSIKALFLTYLKYFTKYSSQENIEEYWIFDSLVRIIKYLPRTNRIEILIRKEAAFNIRKEILNYFYEMLSDEIFYDFLKRYSIYQRTRLDGMKLHSELKISSD